MGNETILAEVGAALHNISSSLSTLSSITLALDTISTLGKRITDDIEAIKEQARRVKQIEDDMEEAMMIINGRMSELDERASNLSKGENELKEKAKRLEKLEEHLNERENKWNAIEMKAAEREDIEATAESVETIRKYVDNSPDSLKLNVGGTSFVVPKKVVMKYPRSLLAEMLREGRFQDNKEVYVDRDPSFFHVVLKILSGTGRPQNVTSQYYQQTVAERHFWLQTVFRLEYELLSPFFSILSTWLPNKFSLIYKSSRDGLSVKTFHSQCDDKGPTLSIIQSKRYLFGGYNADSWASPNKLTSKFNPSSFLFTLTNPHNIPPTRYWLKKESRISITQDKLRLVRFGGDNHDLVIGATLNCYIYFPIFYEDTTGRGKETFTGQFDNTIDELVVFTVQ